MTQSGFVGLYWIYVVSTLILVSSRKLLCRES